jgi:hypothetical protein
MPATPDYVTPEFLIEFKSYNEENPEFFPEGTPLEKQYGYFRGIQLTREKEEATKKESSQKLDEKTEQAQQEREILQKSREIYDKGGFIPYCIENFRKIWYGDSFVLQSILYMAASFRMMNADEPIHLHVAGQTQSGKSDSVKTALKFIPKDDQLTRTFSPKWIFYAGADIHENMMIFSDDTVLSEELSDVYKNILTSWHDGVKRGTVTSTGKALDLTVPRHVSLILTCIENVVEESADGQDESRFLTMEIRRSHEDDRLIREFIQQEKPDITPALEIIHGIWKIIPVREIKLHKELEQDIPIRDFKRFMTLVKCHAQLCNRNQTTDEDIDAIEKFLNYSKPMLDSTTAAYTRPELVLIGALSQDRKNPNELSIISGLNHQQVIRAVHGAEGTFTKPRGGLMAKLKTLRLEKSPFPPYEYCIWID